MEVFSGTCTHTDIMQTLHYTYYKYVYNTTPGTLHYSLVAI